MMFGVTRDDVLLGAVAFGVVFVLRLAYSFFLVHRVLAAIRDKRPVEWSAHSGDRLRWICKLVVGRAKLDLADDDYRERLSWVRWYLCHSLVYLLVVLAAIAWLTA